MAISRVRSRRAAALGALALGVLVAAYVRQEPRPPDAPVPVTYFIAEGSPDSGYRPSDRTLAEWALEAWARQADPVIGLLEVAEDEATIRVHWVRADEGLYGETRARMVDGRPVADVFVRPDVNGLGRDIEAAAGADPLFRDTVVYLTCVHEIGHAFGLAHTRSFADIMYSFQFGGDFVAYFKRFRDELERWDDIRTTSPFSAADREALRAATR